MSTARPVTSAFLLLTLVSACQLDADPDDSTLRSNRAIEPRAGSTEEPTESSDGWVSPGTQEPADSPNSADIGSVSEVLDIDCFGTGMVGVNLGKAANFAILATSEITTVPTSTVIGNLGLSPADGALITGFSLTMANTNQYATSMDVIGNIYAANYKPPTSTNLAAAVVDMELAYTDAAARWPDMTGLGGGDIGGMTLFPAVYNWDADVAIPTDLSLQGCERDVWIFQIAGDLSMSSKASIHLIGGAEARNIFWQVGEKVNIGAGAHFEGVLLTQGDVTLNKGTSAHGRLLVQSGVGLDISTVVAPE